MPKPLTAARIAEHQQTVTALDATPAELHTAARELLAHVAQLEAELAQLKATPEEMRCTACDHGRLGHMVPAPHRCLPLGGRTCPCPGWQHPWLPPVGSITT